MAKKIPDPKPSDDRTMGIGMKCPKCGNEMEDGFVVAQGFIHWNSKRVFFGLDGDDLLPQSKSIPILGKAENVPAYRCTSCRFIHIEY